WRPRSTRARVFSSPRTARYWISRGASRTFASWRRRRSKKQILRGVYPRAKRRAQDDSPVSSGNREQLHLEGERGVRRDGVSGAVFAIGELRRDGELARAADFHAAQPLFPAVHDLFPAQGELKGVLLFLARIELGSVGEPAGVVHDDVPAGRGGRALADDGVFDGQAACRGDGGHGNFLVVRQGSPYWRPGVAAQREAKCTRKGRDWL